jgi:hypothetical protein
MLTGYRTSPTSGPYSTSHDYATVSGVGPGYIETGNGMPGNVLLAFELE